MMQGTEKLGKTEQKTDKAKAEAEGADKIEEAAGKGPKRRVKKHRKVTKRQTTRDDRGYRKTEDVEEYESYSSDESDASPSEPKTAGKTAGKKESQAPAAAKPQAASTTINVTGKKAGGGATGAQRKLSSFFTKG